MVTTLVISLLAVVFGILVGLFPVLPIWIGPVLLIPFIDYLEVHHILIFFLIIAIGSQFFGSVATLLTGIPGETSSLSYAEDSRNFTFKQRINLIRDTAWASLLTGVGALLITWLLFLVVGSYLAQLTSFKIQWAVLATCLLVIIFSSKNFILSALMLLLGIALADKTHPDLPTWIIQAQPITADTTVFLITLAGVIVPSILFARQYLIFNTPTVHQTYNLKLEKKNIKPIVQGGVLGYLIGFMPGPAAMMSSILAYRWPKKNKQEGVIRSESANNAAIVAECVPFMGLGIPINTTAVLVYSLLSLKLVAWPSAIYQTVYGISVYSLVFASAILATILFFFLSTRFLNRYCQLLDHMGSRITWIWLLLLVSMIIMDLYVNILDMRYYFLWAIVMCGIGCLLYKTRVSGISLIFGYVLGDRIIWAGMQAHQYYF
jgi:putative tricarboxylic transport membrane protein